MTQTSSSLSYSTPRKRKIRKELYREKRAVHILRKKVEKQVMVSTDPDEITLFHQLCEKYLSPTLSAINKLYLKLSTMKKCKYPTEYKQFALLIYFLGPKSYKFIGKTLPLPSVRTLRRMTEKWDYLPGLNDFVFKIIEFQSKSMSLEEKECVLCFDEMSIKSNLFYNVSRDRIIGFHEVNGVKKLVGAKSVLVLMARGLHKKWKQPIAYVFVETSCPAGYLKEMILNCIKKLLEIQIHVRALISDMGSNFLNLTKILDITEEKPFFIVNDKKIFYFFDTPHLLKAIRNNFFKFLMVFEDKKLDKIYLEQFYKKDKVHNSRNAPKLTEIHIYPSNFQKMKVKLAAQVFSQSVVAGMSTFMEIGWLPPEASATVDFIGKIDKFFDLLNSSKKANAKFFNRAFIGKEFQINFLNEMVYFFKNVKFISKTTGVDITNKIKFAKCAIITLKSLLSLWENDKKPIYTRRLNQDCLENFFGTIRNQGGNCLNPTPIQFTRAFKKLFCMKYFEQAEGANCLDDLDLVLTDVSKYIEKDSIKESPFNFQSTNQKFPHIVCETSYRQLSLPEKNALTYISGYLLAKCLDKHSCDLCLSYCNTDAKLTAENWLVHFKAYKTKDEKLFGNLNVPPNDFIAFVSGMDSEFFKHFSTYAPETPFMKIQEIIKTSVFFNHPCEHFNKDFLIALFLRLRIFHTIKKWNRELSFKNKGTKTSQKLLNVKSL